MTEMSVALSFLSMVDKHRRSPGDPCRGHSGLQSMEGGALGWEPPLRSARGGTLLSLSELRGQRGGRGGLGPPSPGEVWSINP